MLRRAAWALALLALSACATAKQPATPEPKRYGPCQEPLTGQSDRYRACFEIAHKRQAG